MQKLIIYIVSGIIGCVSTGAVTIVVAARLLASASLVELAQADVINTITAILPSTVVVGALTGIAARNQRVNGFLVALGASLGWLAGTLALFALAQNNSLPGSYANLLQMVTAWIVGVFVLMLADRAMRAT
jgi:hypothetical protein